jgi:predicted Zn-dependent protease
LQQRLHSAEETGTLDWTIGRVAVLNSEGLERSATTTCARLRIACGTGLRQGRALSAARTLQQLDAPGTLERARLRRAEGEADLDPTGISAVCLAPEATAQLLLHLRRLARGAIAFPEGEPGGYPDFPSLAFDPQLHLEDNPLDPEALPFPFDLRGAPLAARDLLTDGKATASFPPPWRLGDERGSHLLLHAGALTDGALLERCDGGLYVSEIERVTCDDPRPLTLRCTFGGGRRIRAGRCTEAVPPETLTLPLLPALEKILGLGGTAVTVAQADGLLGGARAPGLALSLSPPR